MQHKYTTSHKLSENTRDILNEYQGLLQLQDIEDPSELCTMYHKQLTDLYDELAPPKRVVARPRKQTAWFNSQIKAQKKIVRNREMIWLHYQGAQQLAAFKRGWNQYRSMLNFSRSQSISGSILNVKGDAKKLYQVVNELTGTIDLTEDKWLEHESDKDLANSFADYFLDKIMKIREMLAEFASFKPQIKEHIY